VDSATGRLPIPAVRPVATHHGGVLGSPRMDGVGEGTFGFGLGTVPTARGGFVKVVSRHGWIVVPFNCQIIPINFISMWVAVSISSKNRVAPYFLLLFLTMLR
jgi:hypothetical protein